MRELELWGGLECTVNRVGDHYVDQFALLGHRDRPEDIDLIADLGISALRYPIHWETVAPERPESRDYGWYDQRLERLRARGVGVIAGLVHHGSGPRYTDLLDEHFPALLADYARATAERYPWIDDWTPVNEPLTTARFAALYGHWYPHRRDERDFWRALVNQVEGTARAMAAIRSVNPRARLIQTEDLGRSFGTVATRDQVAFDNVRRWASWDLLCGRVVPGHPLHARLRDFGLAARLDALAAAPCPPDVIGVNHYLTSDRFLDHRVARYPAHTHGGNGRQRYADLEAVRALQPGAPGLAGVLREAWARYRLPLAVTEVHNGCTREEQMRWMAEAWDGAVALRHEGVDLRAVTCWSLLGSQGWNTLLTGGGLYEPGVYDLSSGVPRATAMVPLLRALVSGSARDPLVHVPGWWRRPERLTHAAVPRPAPMSVQRPYKEVARDAVPPLLVLGRDDALAPHLAAACAHRAIPLVFGEYEDDSPEAWAVVDLMGNPRPVGPSPTRPRLRIEASWSDEQPRSQRRTPATLVVVADDLFAPDRPPSPRAATPTYVPDLIRAALDLLIDRANGEWHLRHGDAGHEPPVRDLLLLRPLEQALAEQASAAAALPARAA
ncbi:family 1 glycosylhydrolase [Sphingomonas sp. RRHST34]|uniref:Family 1 glycosylhydrolase n=1 Tax=Sphingomonas citri TaxID=2862499 RepID=A0ABS7BNA7_9SPHN|nr:family 1 glycosylhydrolase [Sphingomonas citri]MBW6531104.1 family 1 glycosylhydrolase [Sphingomonas citri]